MATAINTYRPAAAKHAEAEPDAASGATGPASSLEIAEQNQLSGAAPETPPSHIPRTGLVRRLEAALTKKLVLVTAPAGYGKTTLLRALWARLKERGYDCVWLAAGGVEGGGGLAAALVDACVGAGLCGDTDLPRGGEAALNAALSRRLAAHPGPVIIFIDEYQAAQSDAADRQLKLFLQTAPRDCRVVLAARTEPACGGAKLRLDGALGEFKGADLAFTHSEAREIFLNEGLAPAAADRLAATIMGWPAGLGLALLWLRADRVRQDGVNEANINERAARFSGGLSVVANYIAQEIAGDLDDEARDFLMQTALFSSCDEGLADAALSRRDSGAMLRRLDRRGGLVFAGDDGRYRQHPLLAVYFRDRLFETRGADAVKNLRKRSAAWLVKAGDLLPALEHAAEAGDGALIKKILQDPSFGFIAITGDRRRFRRLMARLDDAAPRDARLNPGRALAAIMAGRLKDAKDLLDASRKHPATGRSATAPTAAADAQLTTALYHLHADTPDAEAAVAGLEKPRGGGAMEHALYGGMLHETLGGFYLRAGQVDAADDAFQIAADHFARGHAPGNLVRLNSHRAMIAMMKADIAGAQQFLGAARRLYEQYAADDAALSASVTMGAAAAAYEQGNLTGDIEKLYRNIAEARRALIADGDIRVEPLIDAFRLEANLALHRRGLNDALAILDQGTEWARTRGLPRLQQALMTQKLHLAAAGKLKAAQRFKADLDRGFGPVNRKGRPGFGWREDASRILAEARFEIALGHGDRALIMLDAFDRGFAATDLQWFALKSGALRALALADRREPAAAASLTRALIEKGEAAGMRAFFLEEGPSARALLDATAARFAKTKRAGAFNAALMQWLIAAPAFLPPENRRAAPVLSAQQQRILGLLARGHDRIAMATKAQTTTHNIQYHLKQMFGAFGVSSSLGLVAEATRLGLVEECGNGG